MNLRTLQKNDLAAITADLGEALILAGVSILCTPEDSTATASPWSAGLDGSDETRRGCIVSAAAVQAALGRLPRRGDSVLWGQIDGAVETVERRFGDILRLVCVSRKPYAGHRTGGAGV